jgi:uncharacterized protein YecE (DUF72 family)
MKALVGTSGWQYKDWRGAFYPARLAQSGWLEHYASRFSTVEVNNAFYRLPERATFESWRERTPPGFLVAVKASRYLTHIKRLREPEEPVRRLLERARGLGDRLGPVLLQLPPTLRLDVDALVATLRCFPKGVEVAVEFRHQSWFVESTARVLSDFDAAFCLADAPGWRAPHWRTADWGYLRLHGGVARPAPCYGRRAMQTWAQRLEEMFKGSSHVYVYFNNDANACAPRNAAEFEAIVSPH